MKMKGFYRKTEGTTGGPPAAPAAGTTTVPNVPNIPAPQQPAVMTPGPQGVQTPQPAAQHPATLETQLATALEALQEERGRRSGLDKQNRKYDERIGSLEATLTGINETLEKLVPGDPPPAPEGDPPPAPSTNPEGVKPSQFQELMAKVNTMEAALNQRDTEARRDSLIAEMSKPGQPGEGLNLIALRESIPAVQDETEQRERIETVAGALRDAMGLAAKQAQTALTEGLTPGSSPPPAGQVTELDEAKALHIKLNDPSYLAQMAQDDSAKLNEEFARYDELTGGQGYGSEVSTGYTVPWADIPNMSQELARLQNRVKVLEGPQA